MAQHEFKIGGFSELGTGPRDYGMGVVRIDDRFISSGGSSARWNRHALLKLQVTRNGKTRATFAALRAIDKNSPVLPAGQHLLCLEYDDRRLLGVEKGEFVPITITEAGLWGRYWYFRDHPNVLLRTYTRYTFIVALLGAITGAFVTAVLKRLGL